MKPIEQLLLEKKETKDRKNLIGELKPRDFDHSNKIVTGFEGIFIRFFNAIKSIVWKVKFVDKINLKPIINLPDIKVPEANVKVQFDKWPDIKLPNIKLPNIKVPKSQVEVKIPDVKLKLPPIKIPKQEVIVKMPQPKTIVGVLKKRNSRGDITEIVEKYSDGTKKTLSGINTDYMRVS